jgi:hypothetical protein
MNKKLAILAEHRRQLIAQAASQRAALVAHIEPWRTPLALADSGLAAVRYVKRHPALMIGVVALFAMLRRYPGGKWLQRGWAMYELTRSLSHLLPKSPDKNPPD